jgi:hypothetical protein
MNKLVLILSFAWFMPANSADLPEEGKSVQTAPYFTARLSLQQQVLLYVVKKMVVDKQFAREFTELPLPESIKDSAAVSTMLECLISLSHDQEYRNQSLLRLSLSTDFLDSFQEELNELTARLNSAQNAQEGDEYESQLNFVREQLTAFECLSQNFLTSVRSSSLAELLLLALNDQCIQELIENQSFHVRDTINMVFEWVVLNQYDSVLERFLQNPSLKILVLKYVIDLYTQPTLVKIILNTYEPDLSNDEAHNRIHKALITMLSSLTTQELQANNAELAENIIERLVLLTSLDSQAKELLSVIFNKGVPAEISVFFEEDQPPIPLAALLFVAPFTDVALKIEKISYLVENGLDLSSVQAPETSTNQIIALAQQQYHALKRTHPEAIETLEQARREYHKRKQAAIRQKARE